MGFEKMKTNDIYCHVKLSLEAYFEENESQLDRIKPDVKQTSGKETVNFGINGSTFLVKKTVIWLLILIY